MTKQSLPAVSILSTESIEEFKTADKVVMVAYISADDKTSNTTFSEVADTLRDDYLFGATSDATLAEAEGVTAPAIVLYKDFDEGKNTYSEKFDVAKITEFAKTASTPLVGEVGPETYAGYMAVSNTKNLSNVDPNKLPGRSTPRIPFRRRRIRASRARCPHQASRREVQGQGQLCHYRRKGVWCPRPELES